jgi:predicted Ser/Thr protein kinase
MKTTYTRKNNPLSNTYYLFIDGQELGHLEIKSFEQSAICSVNESKYKFRTKGLLHQYSEIVDCTNNKLIGVIQYNSWTSKAELSFNNKELNWKFNNTRNSKWSLFDAERMITYTQETTKKGQIESNTEDVLLILSGLFIKNHFWQRAVTSLLVVFITCMIVLFL